MAQRHKTASRKRGASRSSATGAPPIAWFVAGLLLGMGVAGFAVYQGMLPGVQSEAQPEAAAGPARGPALIESKKDPASEPRGSRFDFFTVLPEMEVVVPEQELAAGAGAATREPAAESPSSYILQAGSFRNLADADQLKARLALLGTQANIEVVTVNDVRWHRVRIGPVQGARRADEMRRMLQDNGIDTLVLKDSS